jgi:UDP-N-acetylglucosamine:LPS N-acetylglucosamine transferase
MIVEVATMQQAITRIMAGNPSISKYRLAKDLNLSTSSHINNYLTGTTTKARVEVMRAIYNKFGILVEAYKEDPEYKALTKQITEIKI